MRHPETQDLPAGRLVLIGVAGLILACMCAFLGYLFAPRDAFFGEQNSVVTRVIGMAALLVGSSHWLLRPPTPPGHAVASHCLGSPP